MYMIFLNITTRNLRVKEPTNKPSFRQCSILCRLYTVHIYKFIYIIYVWKRIIYFLMIRFSKLTCKQRVFPQLPVFPTGFLSRPKYTGRPGPPSQEFHKFRGQFFSRSSSSLSAQLPQPMPFLNFSFSILYKLRKISIFLSLALNFF